MSFDIVVTVAIVASYRSCPERDEITTAIFIWSSIIGPIVDNHANFVSKLAVSLPISFSFVIIMLRRVCNELNILIIVFLA